MQKAERVMGARRSRRLGLVLVALVAAAALAVLAGCGSSSESGTTASASTGSSTTGASAGADLGLITPGTLTVGMDLVQKPQFYLDEDGKPAGFDYTLLQKLAKDLGLKLDVKNVTFTGLIPGVQANKFDMASDDLSNTPERRKVVDFSKPYFPNQMILAVSESSDKPASIDAWNNPDTTITAQQGAVAADLVTKEFPNAKLKAFPDNNGALLEVATGRADASVVELPILTNFQESNPNKLKSLVFPANQFPPYYGAWAVGKGNTALVDALNKWLCTNMRNGFIGDTYQHFLDQKMPKVPAC